MHFSGITQTLSEQEMSWTKVAEKNETYFMPYTLFLKSFGFQNFYICTMWEPRCLTNLWAFTACYRDSFIYIFFTHFLTFIFNSHHWSSEHMQRLLNNQVVFQTWLAKPLILNNKLLCTWIYRSTYT
jgi:hypothetical protein